MAEKWLRSTAYRGFYIEVVRREDLGVCAYWHSIDGQVKRQAYDQGSAGAAVDHAKRRIAEYHKRIARADYQTPGITRRR